MDGTYAQAYLESGSSSRSWDEYEWMARRSPTTSPPQAKLPGVRGRWAGSSTSSNGASTTSSIHSEADWRTKRVGRCGGIRPPPLWSVHWWYQSLTHLAVLLAFSRRGLICGSWCSVKSSHLVAVQVDTQYSYLSAPYDLQGS